MYLYLYSYLDILYLYSYSYLPVATSVLGTSLQCTDNCFPLLIQQHINGSDAFNRSWEEYKTGFNDSSGNFWLGNELLHHLTKRGKYKLRFELRSRTSTNLWYWAEYSNFVVTSEATKYLMHVDGYSGNWINAFSIHDGGMFTTYDSDNDNHPTENCAVVNGGGFWWTALCVYCGVNTPRGSRLDFRWNYSSTTYRLQTSRMWLTC